MATTTNYGWDTPDDTDLVKDGASAIRTLGSSIDTTVFNNANAAIAKTIVDAKGDLIAATAADTVSRLAVGTNDQVLMADSSTATGLKWGTVASGGMTLISTTTLSGSSTSITSIPTTYKNLQFICRDIGDTGTTTRLSFRPNNNSGIGYYTAGVYAFSIGSSAAFEYNATLMRMNYTQPADSNTPWYSVITIYDYASTTSYKLMKWESSYVNAGDIYVESGTTIFRSDTAITSATIGSVSGISLMGSVLTYGVS